MKIEVKKELDAWNSELIITWDDGTVESYADGMEFEDATFNRDLSWIPEVIEKAYSEGMKAK